MKTRSPLYALAATMLASLLLTACASVSPAPKASLQVYQPRVLQLKAGQAVTTQAGIYVPQKDEVWHSAAAFEQLERENLNLSAALAQERNRK
jgi:outer membrane biogenesis lipoprotein LolB